MTFFSRIKGCAARLIVGGALTLSILLGQAAFGLAAASAHEQIAPSEIAAAGSTASPTLQPAANSGAAAPVTLGSAIPAEIRQWQSIILKYSQQDGVDPNLVAAIMMTESQGNPNAESPAGAVGLMQVMGGSLDPDANIQAGVALLASLQQRYGSDLELTIAAYNAGDGAVSAYNGIPPYAETQSYVFTVLNRYYLYSSS